MRPHVVVHAAVSVDGRLTGFAVDLGRFYGLARSFEEDATLIGADTLLDAEPHLAEVGDGPPPSPPTLHPDDDRPIAVIVDSQGRLPGVYQLRATPHWRNIIVLCSEGTPEEYRAHLEQCRVGCLVTGTDKVDLATALEILHDGYQVDTVRVDGGGHLVGALLRAGLVDELSVLIHPVLVGDGEPTALFHEPLEEGGEPLAMGLLSAEALEDGLLWVRYGLLDEDDESDEGDEE